MLPLCMKAFSAEQNCQVSEIHRFYPLNPLTPYTCMSAQMISLGNENIDAVDSNGLLHGERERKMISDQFVG